VENIDLARLKIEETLAELGSVLSAHLEIRGVCGECRANNASIEKH
jgi:hypothetical protein